ncbi:MAG: hypothetical protein ACYCPQ_08425 [Elusimicrobiota bacterium]
MNNRNKGSAAMAGNINNNHDVPAKVARGRSVVRVEYPGDGDVIAGSSYTFNITAMPEAEGVEISIDRGIWMPCRPALGRWWYDWSGFKKGDHELTARIRINGGALVNSVSRRFSVE